MKWSMLREGNQPGKTEDAGCKVPAVNIRKTETDRVGTSREGEQERAAGPSQRFRSCRMESAGFTCCNGLTGDTADTERQGRCRPDGAQAH